MIENIFLFFLLPLSLLANGILVWYSRRLLTLIEDNSVELRERFRVFHTFLDETYKMDLFYGEPRLKELLELIKDFDNWVEEYESRIIKEDKNDRAEAEEENETTKN